MQTEGRDELCEAMHQDLHKSHFEGYLTEINLIEQEIHDAISNIDEWMEDERVRNLHEKFDLHAVKSFLPLFEGFDEFVQFPVN